MMLTDPAQAKDFVARTAVDALAIAIGTSHGAYKFTRQPSGDILDIARIGQDPCSGAEYAPGDARLLERAAGVARDHSRVRRRHQGDLRRAGGGDPARHPQRRAQGEHRYRHPPGDDRRDAPGVCQGPERIRSAQVADCGRERPRAGCARRASRPSGAPGRPTAFKPCRSRRWPSVTAESAPELRWRSIPC